MNDYQYILVWGGYHFGPFDSLGDHDFVEARKQMQAKGQDPDIRKIYRADAVHVFLEEEGL